LMVQSIQTPGRIDTSYYFLGNRNFALIAILIH
jgi:hypothetical protein